MTPPEKAFELYLKFEALGRDFTRGVSMKEFSKECAVLTIGQIEKSINFNWPDNQEKEAELAFWGQVRKEVYKL